MSAKTGEMGSDVMKIILAVTAFWTVIASGIALLLSGSFRTTLLTAALTAGLLLPFMLIIFSITTTATPNETGAHTPNQITGTAGRHPPLSAGTGK
jgi:hypothetical protein